MNTTTRALLAIVLACGVARAAPAQTSPPSALAPATIEDLMSIVVTTASRAPEGLLPICGYCTRIRSERVDVVVSASKNKVRLTIRDDGKGFVPSGQKGQVTSRMGLRVMKEMAAFSGGGFEIHSRRGNGARGPAGGRERDGAREYVHVPPLRDCPGPSSAPLCAAPLADNLLHRVILRHPPPSGRISPRNCPGG